MAISIQKNEILKHAFMKLITTHNEYMPIPFFKNEGKMKLSIRVGEFHVSYTTGIDYLNDIEHHTAIQIQAGGK